MLATHVIGYGQPALGLPRAPTKEADAWCETRGGMFMCLPRTLDKAGQYKGLQRAINAFLAATPDFTPALEPIRVDARIGPETLRAANAIMAWINGASYADEEDLAENAGNVANIIAINVAGGYNLNVSPDPRKTGAGSAHESPTVMPPEAEGRPGVEKKGLPWWAWALMGTATVGVVAYTIKTIKTRRVEVTHRTRRVRRRRRA
jgi:hypothetical protein